MPTGDPNMFYVHNHPLTGVNPSTNNGWVCPKCGKVWAPWYPECHECNKRTIVPGSSTSGGITVTPGDGVTWIPYQTTTAGG